MIQILQAPVPNFAMFDIGNDKFSMVSAKVIIGHFFRSDTIIFFNHLHEESLMNNTVKTFLFNRLDEILESKNEINSHKLSGNIMGQKSPTAIETTILINRFYIFFSLPNAVFPIGPELAARVKIANDLRDGRELVHRRAHWCRD